MKKENELKSLVDRLEKGEVLCFLDVMTALNCVTELVTLDSRPAAEPAIPTFCDLNGRACCAD